MTQLLENSFKSTAFGYTSLEKYQNEIAISTTAQLPTYTMREEPLLQNPFIVRFHIAKVTVFTSSEYSFSLALAVVAFVAD